MATARQREFPISLRFLPLIVALLAAIGAGVGATLQGLPLPFAVMGVFVVLGIFTSWLTRNTPIRGALFLLLLAIIIIGVVYGS